MAGPTSHREVIEALGGPSKLARSLGIHRATPTTLKWGRRGIPCRYWHRIADLARKSGLKVTAQDLEESRPADRDDRHRKPLAIAA